MRKENFNELIRAQVADRIFDRMPDDDQPRKWLPCCPGRLRIGFPMPVCAVLLQLAEEPALFVPKWSEEILAEVARALAKSSFSLTPSQIDRRFKYMRDHFEEALVTGYEGLVPNGG